MWQLPPTTNKLPVLLISFTAAVVLSLVIFWLMAQLLQRPQLNTIKSLAPISVNIDRVTLKPKSQQKKQEPPKEKPQPKMHSLQPTPPAPSSAPPKLSSEGLAIDAPQFDMKAFELEQQYWSAPVSGEGGTGGDYIGEADTGKKPFTPSATRRPNIPKVAYDNRINGWVLLAYTVDNKGKIDNIRVLDAEPRGIFEANAIAAVKRWVYPSFKGDIKHLSQRIEFEWSMYSYNMDYY